jgi:hypothetical protein
MTRLLAALAALFLTALPSAASSEPADIAAAARGVVRGVSQGNAGVKV